MNEEELREYINKLENEKEDLLNKNEYVTSKIEELNNSLNEKEEEIKNLKLKNYELFVQIPHSYEQDKQPVDNVNTIPLNELINTLKKGK